MPNTAKKCNVTATIVSDVFTDKETHENIPYAYVVLEIDGYTVKCKATTSIEKQVLRNYCNKNGK